MILFVHLLACKHGTQKAFIKYRAKPKKKVRQNSVTEVLGNITKLTRTRTKQNKIYLGEFSGFSVVSRGEGGALRKNVFYYTRIFIP